MPNKKHSVASNVKSQRHEAAVNNTEGAHIPNTKASSNVTEKDAKPLFQPTANRRLISTSKTVNS